MSGYVEALELPLIIVVMLAVPQAIGFGVTKLASRFTTGSWVWPTVAAAAFAIGWHVFWRVQSAQHGKECGAAGALFMIALMLFTPLNAVLGAVLQWLVRPDERRRVDPA